MLKPNKLANVAIKAAHDSDDMMDFSPSILKLQNEVQAHIYHGWSVSDNPTIAKSILDEGSYEQLMRAVAVVEEFDRILQFVYPWPV